MADPVDSPRDGASGADDGMLTAYLDGELGVAERAALEERFMREPALKVRLDLLGRGGRAFGPAYDALLAAAPSAHLQGMFAELAAARGPAPMRRRPWRALAAAVVLLIAGGLIGYLASGALAPRAEPPGWRQVVAEYQGLTISETLAAIPNNPQVLAEELTAIGGALTLDLSPDKLTLPDAALKRADLFRFKDKPLVQLAYLTADSGPISFCIIANGRPDAGRAFEVREGFNVVYWNDAGRGYMLIGNAPRAALEAYAGELAPRLARRVRRRLPVEVVGPGETVGQRRARGPAPVAGKAH